MKNQARCMKPVLLILLLLGACTLPVSADPLDDARRWQALLDAAGVSTVLAQTDLLIKQEVANLEKTPLGFNATELQTLRQQLLDYLAPEQLQADIIARLQQRFDPQQQQSLQALLQSPRTRFLHTLQAQLDDAVVREAMRSYKVQVNEKAPNNHRVQLITELDDSLQHTALETELKVELRKQLLALVTELKTEETFSESQIDAQLQQYRRDVEDSISRNAVYAYLYLFKRTPSPDVQALITTYHDPVYLQFMALCQESLQTSFRNARQRMLQDSRLAGP
jgi:hypothetical protein